MSKKSTRNPKPLVQSEVRAAKRSQFVQPQTPPQKKGNSPWLVVLPIVIVALAGAIFFVVQQQGTVTSASANVAANVPAVPASEVVGNVGGINSQQANKKYPQVAPDANGEFRFPVSAFADGKARFFSATLPDGKPINFFLLKSSDGVIRAAIDACDVCYAARKGYHQEGDVMVCNNCGQRFPSAKINDVKGGCNPAPLTRTIQGDTVVIKLSDLQKDNRAENGQPLF